MKIIKDPKIVAEMIQEGIRHAIKKIEREHQIKITEVFIESTTLPDKEGSIILECSFELGGEKEGGA